MSYILENLTHRPVTFVGNSGKYYHVPPRFQLVVNGIEVIENAFIQKLELRNIVAVREKPKAREARNKAPDMDMSDG